MNQTNNGPNNDPNDDEFIERMNNMWASGDDTKAGGDKAGGARSDKRRAPKPDADSDDDGEAAADSTGRAMEYSGLAFLPMPVPDATNRPPTDPLQWKAFQDKYGTLPYPGPEEEFRQNSFTLNMQTMLYRWAGMDMEERIFKLYSSDEARLDRIRVQSIKRREAGLPDPKNPQDMKANNAHQVQIVLERIQYLTYVLEQNIDITVEQYFRIWEGGTSYKEAVRPLSHANRAKCDRDLRLYIETYRILTGQSGRVSTIEHGVTGSLAEIMRDAMKENGHRAASGESIVELEEAARPALPPPHTLEAEIVLPENSLIEREQPND